MTVVVTAVAVTPFVSLQLALQPVVDPALQPMQLASDPSGAAVVPDAVGRSQSD